MEETTGGQQQSGSSFWEGLDRVVDGVSSTGSSLLEGAGNWAGLYENYFGGGRDTQAARPETVVDRTQELNQANTGSSPAWLQNPVTWALGGLVLLGVGLIVLGKAGLKS